MGVSQIMRKRRRKLSRSLLKGLERLVLLIEVRWLFSLLRDQTPLEPLVVLFAKVHKVSRLLTVFTRASRDSDDVTVSVFSLMLQFGRHFFSCSGPQILLMDLCIPDSSSDHAKGLRLSLDRLNSRQVAVMGGC